MVRFTIYIYIWRTYISGVGAPEQITVLILSELEATPETGEEVGK